MTPAMKSLEVRELRYFVVVAEELNFSRAAERLGMAQPPLSRAIGQLERRLGATLFDRDTHRVELTALGRTLLAEARFALDTIEGVTRRAYRAALTTPTLVATAKPGVATTMLRDVVAAYTSQPGAAHVDITVSGYREQADLVRDGRADVALLSSYFDQRGLDVEPLTTERRVAALPAGHALAQRDKLYCRELAGLPIPRWPGETAAEQAYWSGRDRAADVAPGPDGPLVSDPSQLIEVVALGQAVALIPQALADAYPRPEIAYRPIVDASPYTIAIAWSAGARGHHLAQFVHSATRLHRTESKSIAS
jgi:LysR family transcriptional regulator, benzoate and cis,cis-muconate-responsive activator of ben and cat genes